MILILSFFKLITCIKIKIPNKGQYKNTINVLNFNFDNISLQSTHLYLNT